MKHPGIALIGLIVLVGGIAVFPVVRSFATIAASGKGIPITISMSGFQPSSIQVKHDVPVTLTFVNPDNQYHRDGGGWHQWENSKLGINVMIPPESTKTVTFTFKKKGTYDFVCTVCCGGALNPSMHEVVTVV